MQVMANMCSSSIRLVKFDCNGNMFYSCYSPPIIKIIGTSGVNTTLFLNDTFPLAYDTFTDSKNRLWLGGRYAFAIYN